MSEESTQDYNEQTGEAYLFLSDLTTNKQLASEWRDHLKKASDPQYKIKEKEEYLDNFLADNGYDTTSQAVLNLLKTKPDDSNKDLIQWWTDYQNSKQPNKQSDRFVQDVLQMPDLYAEWSQVLAESANDTNLDKADDFLKEKGYACTAIQVKASFDKMRDQNLNYWTNLYGKTVLAPSAGGDAIEGPPVVVDGVNNRISIGKEYLIEPEYDQGTLTWKKGSGLLTNDSEGNITFSLISVPKKSDDYVGDFFNGEITFNANPPKGVDLNVKYSFTGRVGDVPDNKHGDVHVPGGVQENKSTIQKIADTLSPFVLIGFAITMIFGLGAKMVSWGKSFKDWVTKSKNKTKDAEDQAKANAKDPVKSDRLENLKSQVRQHQDQMDDLKKQLEETGDPGEREKLEDQIKETQEKLEEAQKKVDEENERQSQEENKKLDSDAEEIAEL